MQGPKPQPSLEVWPSEAFIICTLGPEGMMTYSRLHGSTCWTGANKPSPTLHSNLYTELFSLSQSVWTFTRNNLRFFSKASPTICTNIPTYINIKQPICFSCSINILDSLQDLTNWNSVYLHSEWDAFKITFSLSPLQI